MTSHPASRIFRDLARLHVRAQRSAIACRGTSETQCAILTEVGRSAPMSISDLAARLELDKGWISRAVEQLVQEGLVQRATHPSDRRVLVVSLTAAGRRKFTDIEECLNAQVNRVFARLTSGDRSRIAAALALLHEAYAADSAERAPGRSSTTAA